MKKGWTYKKLGEVCEVTDYVANGSFATLRENVTYYNEPNYAILVRLADYSSDFDKSKFVYVDEHSYNFLSKSHLFGGEIIMSNVGSVGKCFICPNLGQPMTIGPNSVLIRTPNSSYFLYYFQSNVFQEKLKTITNKATLSKFNKTQFREMSIRFHDEKEQQRIVSRLDAAFAHIDELKANAEKQLNEARALFQKALEKAMEPKDGWEEKTLGGVGTFIRGGNFSKKDFVEDGYPCIHYGQIHTKLGIATYEHLSCVPKAMVKEDRCASKGDLVIAITSEDDEGSCKCTAWMAEYDAYVGGHSAIFKHTLNPIFVSYYFKSARFQKAKLEYTHGFKVVEINPKDIAKIPICYPSETQQQLIVSRLDSLSENVKKLEEKLQKTIAECDTLKQALLRKVFE